MYTKNALSVTLLLLCCFASIATAGPDYTCFQEAGHYTPQLDIGSDMAIVYGVNASFAERVTQWREKGYTAWIRGYVETRAWMVSYAEMH